ncbi:MAG: hypothetical protein MJE77_31780 [Proteobacteria bacterium]|nr:hypothetical protein [Pseudomonadota bacterium]
MTLENSRLPLGRTIANAFIAALLFLFAVDAIPSTCLYHKWLKDRTDIIGDTLGTWQQEWRLFSPSPDKVNQRITAEVVFSDGRVATWSTPTWREMSFVMRFLKFRQLEYYDHVTQESHRAAWPYLADDIVKSVVDPASDAVPVSVTLERHWVDIAKPGAELGSMDSFYQFPNRKTFYSKKYSHDSVR